MMKSSLIRINLVFILLFLFIPNLTSAETKTFIKEYTYQASELKGVVMKLYKEIIVLAGAAGKVRFSWLYRLYIYC